MFTNPLRGAASSALMIALVFGAGAAAQAQDDQFEGPVIQIGKADPGSTTPQPTEPPAQPETPKYWIGLLGGPIAKDHPLRAHLDIPDSEGLLVASVVPDSPAAKAGLKKNDIMLRANDMDLDAMQDLVDLVLIEGEKHGQIAIELLRRGQRETVYITPEERPADAVRPQGDFTSAFGPGFALPGGVELPQDLLQEFANEPFAFRNFGPGVIIGGRGITNVPNGVSVSITKEDGQPARITVKRGDEVWEVVGDDPGSLNQLPEDLRPFVEQMLHGHAFHGMNFDRPGHAGLPELGEGRLRERLERMERRMQELQERLLGQPIHPPENPRSEGTETK